MKTLIYQYWIGNPTPDWVQISVNRFKKYAEMHGHEYQFTTKQYFHPYFDHYRLVYDDTFKDYDKILYVDVDVVPEVFEEDIFEEQITDIGAIPEHILDGMIKPPGSQKPNREKQFRQAAKRFGAPVLKAKTVNNIYLMYNTGVLLWSAEGLRKARERFLDWKKWNSSFHGQTALDQTYGTAQITQHLDHTELDIKWNATPRSRFEEGRFPGGNFFHYTGGKKTLIEDTYKDDLL